MRLLLLVGLLSPLAACRSTPAVGEHRAASSGPLAPTAAPPAAVASQKPTVSRFHEPIADKPFPEGATDEMVCAAVHSPEKDPWFRFGHIIPFYLDSVVWVGEGTQQELNATLDAIDRYAPNMFSGRGKACSRGGLLVHVDGLGEQVKDSIRRTYTLAELEASTVKKAAVAKEVMRERFIATIKAGMPRLLQACAVDAALCERLLQVRASYGPAPTRGLCLEVLSTARSYFAMTDRSWTTRPDARLDEPALLAKCETLRPADKVCPILADTRAKEDACWADLALRLGL
jgi:hypothetical protein